MVRWLLLFLILPLSFAAMKPMAGITEYTGEVILYVETAVGLCSTIPVTVLGESYTTNLANLRLNGTDCSSFWRGGDVVYVEIDQVEISRTILEKGSSVQMMPAHIISGREEKEVIEYNKPQPEVVFIPVQIIEDKIEDSVQNESITIPSRALENITSTITYTLSDVYYRATVPSTETESVWRYLVLIIFIFLLFIGWGVRS